MDTFPSVDGVIMAAAVADFKPSKIHHHKIKKLEGEINLTLELVRTRDILFELGKLKQNKQFLVGFCLETHDQIENSKKKIVSKNLDFIILNSLRDKRSRI